MKYSEFENNAAKELRNSRDTVDFDSLLTSLDLPTRKTSRKWAFLWLLIPTLAIGAVSTHFMSADSTDGTDTLQSSDDDKNYSVVLGDTGRNDSQEKTAAITGSGKTTDTKSTGHVSNVRSSATAQSKNATNDKMEPQNASTKAGQVAVVAPSQDYSSTQYSVGEHQLDPVSEGETQRPDVTMMAYRSSSQEGSVASNVVDAKSTQNNRKYLATTDRLISQLVIGNRNTQRSELSLVSPIEGATVSGVSSVVSEEDGLFSRMKINCPSFTNAYWRLALVPEVGYFAPIKTLENKTSEPSAAYQNRQSDERTLEGINLGLYGMVVRDRLPIYLKAGISYSRISERMDLSYEYTLQDTTVGIVSSTVSANGDTITHIYGDVISETTYKGNDRQHSYIHLFDLPVSVGYTTYVGGFDVGVEGGVKINLMTRATGNLLVSDTEYTNLSLNRLFKSRIGLSYFGGIMVGRNFGRFGDFFLAPRFHYYAGDFSNDDNPISQKYLTIGLNAGVVYKLK